MPRFWFGVVAVGVYLTPRVNLRRFILLYAALVTVGYFAPSPASWPSAFYLLVGAYLALGIKELAIVDRFTAERTLLVMLLPVLSYALFRHASYGPFSVFSSFFLGAFVFFALREIFRERLTLRLGEKESLPLLSSTAAAFAGVLMAELTLAANFLSVPPLVQAALVLVVAAVLLELLPAYAEGRASRRVILGAVSLGFVLFILVLVSTPIDIHRLSPVL